MSEAAQENILTITAENGKIIGVKYPGPLAQYRFVEALGDASANRVYLGMMLPLIYLHSIDGVVTPLPSSKLQAEGLIERLGEEGIIALSQWINDNLSKKGLEDKAKK